MTECVYQALIDYNQVGNVKVIGFYYSDVILDAIDKEIILLRLLWIWTRLADTASMHWMSICHLDIVITIIV